MFHSFRHTRRAIKQINANEDNYTQNATRANKSEPWHFFLVQNVQNSCVPSFDAPIEVYQTNFHDLFSRTHCDQWFVRPARSVALNIFPPQRCLRALISNGWASRVRRVRGGGRGRTPVGLPGTHRTHNPNKGPPPTSSRDVVPCVPRAITDTTMANPFAKRAKHLKGVNDLAQNECQGKGE